jgi:hypothetical protein
MQTGSAAPAEVINRLHFSLANEPSTASYVGIKCATEHLLILN